MKKATLRKGTFADGIVMFCGLNQICDVAENGSTSFGLWLVEKLQNPITEPEIRASAKGTISYYGAGIRPVKSSKKNLVQKTNM